MPELIRSLVTRLREFVGNRRHAPRYRVSLPLRVSLVEARSLNGERRPLSLDGHTYDISATGVGLIVSAIRIGGQYLTGEGRALRLAVELPEGTVQLHVRPVRYEHLEEEGYLIGAHILEMSAEDRTRYLAYLKTL